MLIALMLYAMANAQHLAKKREERKTTTSTTYNKGEIAVDFSYMLN